MGYQYRVLFIDVSTGEKRVENFDAPEVLGPLDLGVKMHFERYASYQVRVFNPRNVLVVGRGVFAGGRIFGAHRLLTVFRSPMTRGLHVSAVGGAAYKFVGTGLSALVVEGRSEEPAVILVEGDESGFRDAWVESIPEEELWDIYAGYKGARGVHAFALYLLDKYDEFFRTKGARALLVGPAALKTINGAIFSPDVDATKGGLRPGAFDSAARGGGGSVMYQAHGVVAIVFGGSYKPVKDNPKLGDTKLLDEIAKKVFGKSYTQVVLEATKKYRFDPKLGTGGTFGVNYVHYRALIPMFNFNTIYYSPAIRLMIHEKVVEYFWKPFQKEVFEKEVKPWYTCGEPCPAACKKVWRGVKADYEPFNGMGPMVGVLKLEDAAKLVELADALGYDVIELGHVVAWLFDLMHRGLLDPRELGLPRRPFFDPLTYNPEEHSKVNAELAERIIEGMVYGESRILRTIAEKGIREAARELDKLYSYRVKMHGMKFEDAAVYASFGEEGYMTPNYYWSPGMVAPLYVLGRYWTNYSPTFSEPEAYAESSFARALKEYQVDNAGFCRFHRGWAEKMLPHLYREVWGVEVDLDQHAKRMYKVIAEYQRLAGAEPTPWETRKTMDLVATVAAEVENAEWVDKFARSPQEAAYEWWKRFKDALDKMLGR